MSLLKIDNGSRGFIRTYDSLRRKLHNCHASVYFNEQCPKKRLDPSNAEIKIPISPAHKYTQQKITNIRIKNEIRYLHRNIVVFSTAISILIGLLSNKKSGKTNNLKPYLTSV